ncbi:hypothetical protein AVEN_111960-1 [Araneus ventricosus]|uniref:Uncharacterized protein n=1 Tax=Araneus ventricosus TaxID=182803 RepID=A0A4Y2ICK3_ARAVE|nr:hypothetical protein AVEN_111960-1 [Araneus ventricosus]
MDFVIFTRFLMTRTTPEAAFPFSKPSHCTTRKCDSDAFEVYQACKCGSTWVEMGPESATVPFRNRAFAYMRHLHLQNTVVLVLFSGGSST